MNYETLTFAGKPFVSVTENGIIGGLVPANSKAVQDAVQPGRQLQQQPLNVSNFIQPVHPIYHTDEVSLTLFV